MRGAAAGVIALLTITTACARAPSSGLIEYRDSERGFVVWYPAGWTRAGDLTGRVTRFVPPRFAGTPEAASEFILVLTMPSASRLDETGRRRAVFSLLPIHGVSAFQRDGRTNGTATWERFEVTGASGEVEWASLGLVAAADARYYLLVCAKPLAQWRTGQQQCQHVIATFQAGALTQ